MTLLAFEPETAIEQRILDVQAQTYSADALMREMANHDLYIPSKGEVREDGRGFVPVRLDQGGMPFVMAFTAAWRRPRGLAEYLLKANAGVFFRRLPSGYGVIFNPGYDAQLLLPPDGVAMLKQDLHRA
jgi:hypothetical protein